MAEHGRGRLFRAAGELATIIAGVLIALAADQAMERRAERALEADYITSLLDDLDRDLEQIRLQREQISSFAQTTSRLLGVLEAGTFDGSSEELVHLLNESRFVIRFEPTATTIEELTGTGGLRLVRDRAKVRAVLEYHQRVAAGRESYWILWERMANELLPAMRELVDARLTASALRGPEEDVVPSIADLLEAGAQVDPLRDSEHLQAALRAHLEFLAVVIGELDIYQGLCAGARVVVAGTK